MPTISRHAGAPYQDGETLAAADLETDFENVYTAINNGLDSANLADDAVTARKLASQAVVFDSIVDGSCSASEAQVTDNTGVALSLSYQTVGTAVTHNVSNPARHVVIFVSGALANIPVSTTLSIQLLKDGVSILGASIVDTIISTSGLTTVFNRTYIDTAPTAGGTHVYTFQAKSSSVAGTVKNVSILVFEPKR